MEAIKLENVRVYQLGEIETKGDKGFKSRALIVEVDYGSQYPQFVNLEATQDKCSELDKLSNGDVITVHANLRGRLWTNKQGVEVAFNSLNIWKFEIVKSSESQNLPF
jgi:hypothetical protein